MQTPLVSSARRLVLGEKRIATLPKPFAELYVTEQVIHDGGERCRIKKVRDLADGRWYVAKVQLKLQVRGRREDFFRKNTERMLNLPESPYVVKVCACYEDDCYFYTLMENLEGDDLYQFFRVLHPKKTSSMHQLQESPMRPDEHERVVRKLIFSMLKSLQHLHVQGLVHKDVKLENFVFKRKSKRVEAPKFNFMSFMFSDCAGASNKIQVPSELKLIDFDFLHEVGGEGQPSHVLGTDGYIAPEVYLGSPCPESDVFSAGVVFYALMCGRMPFSSSIFDDEENENYVGSPKMKEIHGKLENYKIWFGRFWDDFPDARHLCESMLAIDVKQRFDTHKAVRHPWFSSITSVSAHPAAVGPSGYPGTSPIAAQAA
jgi:calcium-dependent protein kinase